MSFRMKEKHWSAKGLTAKNYDPKQPVLLGSQGCQERIVANDSYKASRTAEYEKAKGKLFDFLNKDSEKKRKTAPPVLTLDLKHGDMVVMHGKDLQRIYEVGILHLQTTV